MTPTEVKGVLGNPESVSLNPENEWVMLYKSGDYYLYITAEGKDKSVTSALIKKGI